MNKKKGFTLLEVMIVVVIALSVVAFALPAYKKSQERNKFMAAQGVLIELSNGVRTMMQQYPNVPFGNWMLQDAYQSRWSDACEQNITGPCVLYAMFHQKVVSPIPFDSGTSAQYKGYVFYTCSLNSPSSCCVWGTSSPDPAVVCMRANASTNYRGAWITQGGSLVVR